MYSQTTQNFFEKLISFGVFSAGKIEMEQNDFTIVMLAGRRKRRKL